MGADVGDMMQAQQEKIWKDICAQGKLWKRHGRSDGFVGTYRTAQSLPTGSLEVRFVHRCGNMLGQEDKYRMSVRWNVVRLLKCPEARGFWVFSETCGKCRVWVAREVVARHVGMWRLNGGKWEVAAL